MHGHYGPPIGSRPLGGRDPIIFEAPYLRNGAR